MALLSEADRADTAIKLIRKVFVDLNETANLTTEEARTLVNDVDAWADANAISLNNAISQPVRGKATTQMKAYVLALVALKRAGGLS